jgi:hypothetical protein
MRRTLIGLATGLVVTGVLAAPSAHAHSHFSFYFGTAPVVVAPPVYVQPAPVVVAPPYYPVYGNVWQPGYYGWYGYQRHWVPGRWVRHANWNRGWGRGYGYGTHVRGGAWRR